MMRSALSISERMAFRRVVLPVDVPPEIRIFFLARVAELRNCLIFPSDNSSFRALSFDFWRGAS